MIDSPCQLILRILTGMHAGVELLLSQDRYLIGHSSLCDIVISDWPIESMQVVVTNRDSTMPTISFIDQDTTRNLGLQEAWLVGEIIVTSYDARYPESKLSDVAILRNLMAPAVRSEKKKVTMGNWILAVTIIIASVACSVALQTSGSVAATKKLERPKPSVAQLSDLLKSGKYPEIKLTTQGNITYVDGLVKNHAQFEALSASVVDLSLANVVRRFVAASEISELIVSAIAQPGASVSYVGLGRFEVSGVISEAIRQRLNLEKLRADIGPLVKEISFSPADNFKSPGDPLVDNVQNTHGYELKIAKDGSKYFLAR